MKSFFQKTETDLELITNVLRTPTTVKCERNCVPSTPCEPGDDCHPECYCGPEDCSPLDPPDVCRPHEDSIAPTLCASDSGTKTR